MKHNKTCATKKASIWKHFYAKDLIWFIECFTTTFYAKEYVTE